MNLKKMLCTSEGTKHRVQYFIIFLIHSHTQPPHMMLSLAQYLNNLIMLALIFKEVFLVITQYAAVYRHTL